jgi:hypothetical protein
MSVRTLRNSKKESKQMTRKIIRLLQINSRLLIIVLLILCILIIHHLIHVKSLKFYVPQLFKTKLFKSGIKHFVSNDSDDNHAQTVWSPATVEIFRMQLGLSNYENGEQNYECHVGSEFILSALFGTEKEDLSEILWQYFSIEALASQTIQRDEAGKELSLKAFITNRMILHLNHLFDG